MKPVDIGKWSENLQLFFLFCFVLCLFSTQSVCESFSSPLICRRNSQIKPYILLLQKETGTIMCTRLHSISSHLGLQMSYLNLNAPNGYVCRQLSLSTLLTVTSRPVDRLAIRYNMVESIHNETLKSNNNKKEDKKLDLQMNL